MSMINKDSQPVHRFPKIIFLALRLLTALAITSCQGQINQSSDDPVFSASSDITDCRTIEHEMGETVVCGQPQRIVVLGPYILEPLLALDVQPVGYAEHVALHQGDYTEPSKQIPYLGNRVTQPLANVGLAYTPSVEGIVKTQPDLILAVEGNDYATLAKIAPTVVLEDRDNADQNLRVVAKAVDRTEQAEQVIVQTQQRIAEAQQTFAALTTTHPQVVLLDSPDLIDIRLSRSGGLCNSLIETLGFELTLPPGTNDDPSSAKPISIETLPQLNDADLIILLGSNFSELDQLNSMERFEEHQLSNLKQAWKESEIAQSLNASKAGRVYFIPAYLCRGLPGPIGTELYLEELEEQLLSSS